MRWILGIILAVVVLVVFWPVLLGIFKVAIGVFIAIMLYKWLKKQWKKTNDKTIPPTA